MVQEMEPRRSHQNHAYEEQGQNSTGIESLSHDSRAGVVIQGCPSGPGLQVGLDLGQARQEKGQNQVSPGQRTGQAAGTQHLGQEQSQGEKHPPLQGQRHQRARQLPEGERYVAQLCPQHQAAVYQTQDNRHGSKGRQHPRGKEGRPGNRIGHEQVQHPFGLVVQNQIDPNQQRVNAQKQRSQGEELHMQESVGRGQVAQAGHAEEGQDFLGIGLQQNLQGFLFRGKVGIKRRHQSHPESQQEAPGQHRVAHTRQALFPKSAHRTCPPTGLPMKPFPLLRRGNRPERLLPAKVRPFPNGPPYTGPGP